MVGVPMTFSFSVTVPVAPDVVYVIVEVAENVTTDVPTVVLLEHVTELTAPEQLELHLIPLVLIGL